MVFQMHEFRKKSSWLDWVFDPAQRVLLTQCILTRCGSSLTIEHFAQTKMESNAFAQSKAKNTSEPSFAAQVRSNKRLATNKASAQPRPVRKPNCVGQILASAPAAFNLRSKIVANSL